MTRYVIRRILLAIPVLIGASFLIFLLVYGLPGDPIAALVGDQHVTPQVVAGLRDRYNLDDPFLVQYGKYVWGLLHGDLGLSIQGQRPISDIIGEALPVTIKLTVIAVLFEIVFGILAGVLSALKKGSFLDNLVLVSTTFLVSIPVFVLGFVAQYVFAYKLDMFPIAGTEHGLYSYLLPGIILASLSMSYVARLTRSSVIESMNADYIRTARAKGLSRSRIVVRHGLRNSLIPVVTFIGADIGALLGGAIVTERIYSLPGLGSEVFDGIYHQDGPTVVGIVTLMVFFYIFFNLIVDILYAVLDPRIRYA